VLVPLGVHIGKPLTACAVLDSTIAQLSPTIGSSRKKCHAP
jgi:hypothetical protein